MTGLRSSIVGPIGGALISSVAYVSDFKSIPLFIYLWAEGVKNPGLCLLAMSNPRSRLIETSCSPITGAQNLDALFLVATLIAVFLIVWAGIDGFKKLNQ
jgi:hypothetical protein